MEVFAKGSRGLKVLALALAIANLALWYAAPWLRNSSFNAPANARLLVDLLITGP
jgi:hypothetical protein